MRQAKKKSERKMHECRYFYADDPTKDATPNKEGKLPEQHFDSPVGRFYRSVPKLQWIFRDNFHCTDADFAYRFLVVNPLLIPVR